MGAVCSACIAPKDADPSAPGAAGKYEVANLTPRQKQVLRAIEKFPELLEIRDKFHDADTAGAGCLNPERGVALVLASLGETHEPNALESHSPRFRRLAERLELDGESSSVTEEDLLIRLARFARTKTRSGANEDAGSETDALDVNLFRDLAPLLDAAASAATSLANQGLSEFDASSPPAREREAPAAEAPAAEKEKEKETASAAAPAPAAKKKKTAPRLTAVVAEKRPVASLPALTPDEAKAAQMSKERLERVMAKSKMPSAKYLQSIPSLKKKGAGEDEDAFDDGEFDAEYKLSSPTTSSKDLAVEKQYALSSPGPSGDFGDVSANVKATRERAERAVAEKKKTKAEKASAEPFRNY